MTDDDATILKVLLSGDHPCLGTLRRQRDLARVTTRNWTGVGLFVHFEVPDSARRLDPTTFYTVESQGRLGGQDGIFILFVRTGVMQMLEFAAWDGDVPEGGRLERIDSPGRVCIHPSETGSTGEE